ncbi:histidinol-phosphate transaminase [Mastigocoleus testarum]|uniref:Histidinol-phosphate aminotransferase n=1 Tax=Mastigocoleus testarum BC008 TaxID=371196 RepID=A0A0V7ZSU8_9CYAN|nr:histidinol-phosphate transaminase [Mastigocoleus testarum]KST67576.1 histidinol-phosphate aminotransferase [Mastigocoleus testarum BC008]KST69788.1 histidinol-phosphate aminotransferase [Mastigocoleus testarum BC008]
MLPFIRSDLAKFSAYKPHPGSNTAEPVATQFDRLDTNESPYDLPIELKKKLAANYERIIETNRYPDGGHQNLKRAIAGYVNESVSLPPNTFSENNISVGNGSDELIRSILIATCLGEGSILVANPTFSMYGITAQTLGIPVIQVGRNQENFEIDLQAAQTAIEQNQNPPVRVVFVVHPNSPTANPLTETEINWLRKIPENILVVIDEAYFEFCQHSLVSELQNHSNWIVLRTFSKAFRLASMRVGYCVANPNLIAILEKVRLPYNLPSFSIAAALIAMENRHTLLETIPQTISERINFIETFSKNPELKIWQSSANFVFLKLQQDLLNPEQKGFVTLTQRLKDNGTLVRQISGGLRITIGTPEENIRTIERLKTVLNSLYPQVTA